MATFRIATLLVLGNCVSIGVAEELTRSPSEDSLAFNATSVDGESVRLQPESSVELTVVCFLGVECPLAKLYAPRLESWADQYRGRVRFVGVNSNRQDSADDLRRYRQEHQLSFPLIKDEGNVLADRFGAERTPEVFVVDRNLIVRYRGRIDDQYMPGIARPAPKRQDLQTALEQLLSGQEVEFPETEAVGCLIGRVKTSPIVGNVTYCKQIARIFQQNCLECHRDGEIGPFAMNAYDEVVGWADMILEVVEEGRMPPWHANPEFGHFANERMLSADEKQQLRQWVSDGAPYGDASDLPAEVEFVDGWRLPKQPDLVVTMRDRPFVVPPDGTVEYQYFVVDPGFEKDTWVTAAQVVPGNRAVVHHSIVFIRPPDGAQFRGIGWLAAYVPGHRAAAFLPWQGRMVPAGSKLVFQQHYTPTGKEESDQTKIGLVFGDDREITHESFTLVGIDQEFEIPPNEEEFPVESKVRWLPDDGQLLAVMPHMHLRGKSFRLQSSFDGDETVLLDVPKYDFNWQHRYEFVEPLSLAKIDELRFRVAFDNSSSNPVNPDPNEFVSWGDQTWEEMAVAFFDVAVPRVQAAETERKAAIATESPDFTRRVNEFADQFMDRFDKNNDGVIERDDTPISMRRFGFYKYDANRDGQLTRDEVEQAARRRLKR